MRKTLLFTCFALFLSQYVLASSNNLSGRVSLDELQIAADNGSPLAQYRLGMKYYSGDGVDKSYEKSIVWFKRSAAKNNADAQEILSLLIGQGQGAKADSEEAYKWLLKAAKNGSTNAAYDLCTQYYGFDTTWVNGKPNATKKQNYVEAYAWCSLALNEGQTLAKSYMEGSKAHLEINEDAYRVAKKLSEKYIKQYKKKNLD